jgi:hypothetical protein
MLKIQLFRKKNWLPKTILGKGEINASLPQFFKILIYIETKFE